MKDNLLVVSFPVPIVRDSNRELHQPFVWDRLHEKLLHLLCQLYGGEHSRPIVYIENINGSWQPSESDPPVKDSCRKYTVYMPQDGEPKLREFIHKVGNTFDQKTMALEIAGKAEIIVVQSSYGFLWDD
jgi:hypothetical protein